MPAPRRRHDRRRPGRRAHQALPRAPRHLRRPARCGARRRRHLLHDRRRQDPGRGGRIRVRQDHDGQAGAGTGGAHRRHHAVRGSRPRHPGCSRTPALPQVRAGGVPGPVCLAQSAHAHQRHHRRAPDHQRGRRACRGAPARAGAARPGRPAGALGRSLPARVLGRPAPAHRHRPRARPVAQAGRAGRAGLGPRRLDPRPDPEPAARPAGEARPLLPLHRPRPRRRGPYEPPDRGDVSRQDRRKRRGARASPATRSIPTPRRCSPPPCPAIPTSGARTSRWRAKCRARSIHPRAAISIRAARMPCRAAASRRHRWRWSGTAWLPATCSASAPPIPYATPAPRRAGRS